jgi:hypothetical protein
MSSPAEPVKSFQNPILRIVLPEYLWDSVPPGTDIKAPAQQTLIGLNTAKTNRKEHFIQNYVR